MKDDFGTWPDGTPITEDEWIDAMEFVRWPKDDQGNYILDDGFDDQDEIKKGPGEEISEAP